MLFKKNKKDKTIGCEMKLNVMTRKLKRGPDVKTPAQPQKRGSECKCWAGYSQGHVLQRCNDLVHKEEESAQSCAQEPGKKVVSYMYIPGAKVTDVSINEGCQR